MTTMECRSKGYGFESHQSCEIFQSWDRSHEPSASIDLMVSFLMVNCSDYLSKHWRWWSFYDCLKLVSLKKKNLKKIWNRVDCQRSEKRSKTHKRLKERFLIRQNRTKCANFQGNNLFQDDYVTGKYYDSKHGLWVYVTGDSPYSQGDLGLSAPAPFLV